MDIGIQIGDDSDVVVISDDEGDEMCENDERTLAVPEVRRVTQTVTLTFRRTITYVQGVQTDVEHDFMW